MTEMTADSVWRSRLRVILAASVGPALDTICKQVRRGRRTSSQANNHVPASGSRFAGLPRGLTALGGAIGLSVTITGFGLWS